MFKIKRGYYLELLTFETKKLLGSSKGKITKDENALSTVENERILHRA